MSCGPVGYLVHWSSGKLVHPKGGSSKPGNDTPLVVHSARREGGQTALQVRFVAVPGAGHFGYIEHVSSKKIVHPHGGSLTPGDDTVVVYHSDRHAAALFAFDEENELIVHRNGKVWQPRGGSPHPANDTKVVLHHDRQDSARFYFVDTSMKKVSPYPSPNLSGDWKIVHVVINPQATHSYTYTYKVGRSKTHKTTEHQAWSITGNAAYDLFSASVTYSGFVQREDSQTWSEETEITRKIVVTPGKSVVTWQYTFDIEQYGDKISFRSDHLGDTNSIHVKPNLETKGLTSLL